MWTNARVVVFFLMASCGFEETIEEQAIATPPQLGVNIHTGSDGATNTQRAAIMQQRNLRSARMDLWAGDQTAFRDQVIKIRANGGSVEVSLQTSFQWDNSCNQNLAAVEQTAYSDAYALVNQHKDIVFDYEMLNETQLRPEIMNEVAWNQQLGSTAGYQNKPCVASLTAALKGISHAIRDVRTQSGQPLRVILGEVGRDFGFLTYMQQQGVQWDVTGFHNYPREENALMSSDPWFGTGGPLAQMAAFGKPIRFNEFNCGEIYDGNFENQAGQPDTEKCFRALVKHLRDLRNQTVANLESVSFYELVDEPGKPAPENHFGIMYNLTTPKVSTYVAAAFAGGTLTTAERNELTSRNLLTNAEIDSMQQQQQAESANNTTIPSASQIVDALGAVWTVSGGVIYRNGTATISSSVTLLLYWNHVVYQQNGFGDWWYWDNNVTQGNPWTATTDPRVVQESANNTTIPPSTQIVDALGATWTVSGGVIYRNGAQTISSSVTLLLYASRVVYQQNGFGAWWYWDNNAPAGANPWTATTDPRTGSSDTTAPTVSITSPSNGAVFARHATITVSATASDNVGVVDVTFSLNGALVCTDATSPYGCAMTLPSKRNSTSTILVRARDAAGNASSQSIQVFTN